MDWFNVWDGSVRSFDVIVWLVAVLAVWCWMRTLVLGRRATKKARGDCVV
jgi:hypothetical protein